MAKWQTNDCSTLVIGFKAKQRQVEVGESGYCSTLVIGFKAKPVPPAAIPPPIVAPL